MASSRARRFWANKTPVHIYLVLNEINDNLEQATTLQLKYEKGKDEDN